MDFNDYQRKAVSTAKMYPTLAENLNHAALGLTTEVGEFTTEVKRAVIYEREITLAMREHMLEELGDTLWYIALAAEALGVNMNGLARENIAKLQKRYPQAYSNEAAEARADKGGLEARVS